jgi:hypothetical protein
MKLNNRKIRAILMIVVLGLALLIWSSVSAAIGNAAKTQVPIDPFAKIIQAYQTEMANPRMDATSKAGMTHKFSGFFAEATQRAEVNSKVQSDLSLNEKPFSTATTYIYRGFKAPDGISNNPVIPIHTSDYKLTSSWVKTIGNDTYLVYAGALSKDPSQGPVYVESPTLSWHTILSPVKSGALKIISYTDLVLTLQSEKGDLIYFDAKKEQFIENTNMQPSLATAYP